MMDAAAVAESFRFLLERPRARICFHGHTHVPFLARLEAGGKKPQFLAAAQVRLSPGLTYLINPGSVGQPRDGNARASFGILDTERQLYRTVRVAYGLEETRRKILGARLPGELAQRLGEGW